MFILEAWTLWTFAWLNSDRKLPGSDAKGAPVLGLLQTQPAAEEWRAALHRRQHPVPWICRLSLLVKVCHTLVYTTHNGR